MGASILLAFVKPGTTETFGKYFCKDSAHFFTTEKGSVVPTRGSMLEVPKELSKSIRGMTREVQKKHCFCYGNGFFIKNIIF